MIYIHCLNSRVNWHLPFSKIFLTLSCNIMPWSSLSALQRVNSNILTAIILKTKHTIVCIGVSIPSEIPPYSFIIFYQLNPSYLKSASCPRQSSPYKLVFCKPSPKKKGFSVNPHNIKI